MRYSIHLNERGHFFATIDDATGTEMLRVDNGEAEFLSEEGIDPTDGEAVIEYYRELGCLEEEAA
jgi:hypothetical protein